MLALLRLPGVESSIPVARRSVLEVLQVVGYAAVGDLPLLASELVTNAIKHTRSGHPGGLLDVVILDCGRVEAGRRIVRVEVVDQGSALVPVARRPDDYSHGGRGLWIVQGLAERWGFWNAGDKRGVWFELKAAFGPQQHAAAGSLLSERGCA